MEMNEEIAKRLTLTRRQRRAIQLLLDGHTTTQIAVRLGVSEKKIWKWLERPRLAERVAELEADREACRDRRTLGLLDQAFLMLEGMMKSQDRRTQMFAVNEIRKLIAHLPQIRQRSASLRLSDAPAPSIQPTAWQGPQSN